MSHEPDPFLRPRHLAGLWLAVLAAPLAWGLQMTLNYALVPHLCRGQHGVAAVQAIGAVALLTAAWGLLACRRHWRAGAAAQGEGASTARRTRFLALFGLALGALLLAAIVAQVVPSFWISPCD